MDLRSRTRKRAFTLIELLVVIAIIATLMGLLLPAVQKVREAAARAQSADALKQFGLACHSFNDVKGVLPPAMGSVPSPLSEGGADGPALFHLLPYLEQQFAYQQSYGYDPNYTYYLAYGSSYSYYDQYNAAPYNFQAYRAGNLSYSYSWNGTSITYQQGISKLPLIGAPGDPSLYSYASLGTSYLANSEAMTGSLSVQQIADGSSNTILFAEGYSSCYGDTGWGSNPNSYLERESYLSYDSYQLQSYNFSSDSYSYTYIGPTFQRDQGHYSPGQDVWDGTQYVFQPGQWIPPMTFQSRPPLYSSQTSQRPCYSGVPQSLASGSIQVLLGDGSVQSVSNGVSLTTWQAAITPNNGDTLGSDW